MPKMESLKDKIKNLEAEMLRGSCPADTPPSAAHGHRSRTIRTLKESAHTEFTDKRMVIGEEIFRAISESSPDAIIITDSEYYVRYWSLGAKKVFGYGESEIINRPLEILLPEPYRKKHRYYKNLYMETGTTPFMGQIFETQGLCKDRRIIPVEISISSWKINGWPLLSLIIRDITKRKKTEAALQAGEEKFRRIFEESPIGIALYDADFKLITANANCMNILGIMEPQEVIGSSFLQDIKVPDCVKNKIQDGEPVQFETCFDFSILKKRNLYKTNKDGLYWFDVLISPYGHKAGNAASGYLLQIQDISERKKSEEALKKAHSEMEQKVQERTRDLEEANTALRLLLKGRHEDKAALEEKIIFNMKELVLPYIEKIKSIDEPARRQAYIDMLESNLNDITTPFMRGLKLNHLKLTKAETQVANLIREGKSTREIAAFLDLSRRTVDFHRNNIRKKCDIKHKRINLRSFLLSL